MEILEPGITGNKIHRITILHPPVDSAPGADALGNASGEPGAWESLLRAVERKFIILEQHQTELFQCLQETLKQHAQRMEDGFAAQAPVGETAVDEQERWNTLVSAPVAALLKKFADLEAQWVAWRQEAGRQQELFEELRQENVRYRQRVQEMEQQLRESRPADSAIETNDKLQALEARVTAWWQESRRQWQQAESGQQENQRFQERIMHALEKERLRQPVGDGAPAAEIGAALEQTRTERDKAIAEAVRLRADLKVLAQEYQNGLEQRRVREVESERQRQLTMGQEKRDHELLKQRFEAVLNQRKALERQCAELRQQLAGLRNGTTENEQRAGTL